MKHAMRFAPVRPFGIACALFAACCLTGAAVAQQPTSAQASTIRQACRADYMAHCLGTPPGGEAALACLKQNASRASPGCQQALGAASGVSSTPAAPRAVPGQAIAATPQSAESTWPHTVAADGGSAVVYQPQVVSWPERATLNTRIAVGITPTGAKAPVLGTIEVAFGSATDLATRLVTLTDPKLASTQFPTIDTNQAVRFEDAIKAALGKLGVKQVPLDTVLLSLRQQTDAPPAVPLKNDPPAIFYSDRPASLVVFNGEPVLAPVAATSLSAAVNTNWDVFFNPGTTGTVNPNAGGRSGAFGQSEGGGASRQPWGNSAPGQQLDQDRFARTEGAQRFQQFGRGRGRRARVRGRRLRRLSRPAIARRSDLARSTEERDASVYLVSARGLRRDGCWLCAYCREQGHRRREGRGRAATAAPPATPARRVYVQDFALDVDATEPPRTGLLGRPRLFQELTGENPQAHARRIVDEMASSLVKDLNAAGVPAERLATGAPLPPDGWLVRGVFTEADSGQASCAARSSASAAARPTWKCRSASAISPCSRTNRSSSSAPSPIRAGFPAGW